VQKVVRNVEYPTNGTSNGTLNPPLNALDARSSYRQSSKNHRMSNNQRGQGGEMSRFSVRSSINRASYLQFNMGNLDVAINALADQADDFSLYKDYLNIGGDLAMDQTLSKFGDRDVDGCCFSDYIWVFDNKMRRKRKRILITGQFIYIFSSGKKPKLLRNYPLASLTQVAISAKNYTLMLLSFKQNYDMLIDSYRRLDIILYMVQRMRYTREGEKHPDFKLIYLKNFRLRKRNREEVEINYKEGMKGELKIL
jgi:hypothetical protein